MLTCSLALASWLLGTFPSSHCSPSRTSITVAVRKMALTWWVGRSISSYHMLGIAGGAIHAKTGDFECQEWAFPKPARKIQIKILKNQFSHIKFCVGSCVTSFAEQESMDAWRIRHTEHKKEEQFSFVKWKEIFKESLTYTNIRLDLDPYRGLPWWLRW